MKPIKEMLNVATSPTLFFSTNQEFIPKLPSQGKLELKNPSVMFRTITTSYEDYKETKKTL